MGCVEGVWGVWRGYGGMWRGYGVLWRGYGVCGGGMWGVEHIYSRLLNNKRDYKS